MDQHDRETARVAALCEWTGPDHCENCRSTIPSGAPVYCFMDSGEQPEPTYVGDCCVGVFLGDPCAHTFDGDRCTRCGEFTDEFYERTLRAPSLSSANPE